MTRKSFLSILGISSIAAWAGIRATTASDWTKAIDDALAASRNKPCELTVEYLMELDRYMRKHLICKPCDMVIPRIWKVSKEVRQFAKSNGLRIHQQRVSLTKGKWGFQLKAAYLK